MMIRLLVKAAVGLGLFFVGLAVLVAVVVAVFGRAEKQRLEEMQAAAKKQAVEQTQRAEDRAKRDEEKRAEAAQADLDRKAIADALVATFDPTPAGWGSFEVSKADLTGIGQVSASLYYTDSPSGYLQVQEDTKQVVRAILDWLKGSGRDPAKQWITVTVRAKKTESGETGKELVRIYGRSVYDFNRDQIAFTKDE